MSLVFYCLSAILYLLAVFVGIYGTFTALGHIFGLSVDNWWWVLGLFVVGVVVAFIRLMASLMRVLGNAS